MIIRTLEADTVDVAQFDERAGALSECFEATAAGERLVLDPSAAAVLGDASPHAFRVPLEAFPRAAAYMRSVLAYGPVARWMEEARKLPLRERY